MSYYAPDSLPISVLFNKLIFSSFCLSLHFEVSSSTLPSKHVYIVGSARYTVINSWQFAATFIEVSEMLLSQE